MGASAASLIYLPSSSTCSFPTQFFSHTSLSCKTCFDVDNAEISVDADNSDAIQYFAECQCKSQQGFIKYWDQTALAYQCRTCASLLPNSAPSRDQSLCIPCGASTGGYDATIGDCSCAANNEALVEKNSLGAYLDQKQCIACPSGTVKTDLYTCAACTQATCPCESAQFSRDSQSGECLEASLLTEFQTSYTINNLNIQYTQMRGANTIATLESAYLRKHFYRLATKCRSAADRQVLYFEECTSLANLCAATLYNTDLPPCNAYLSIISSTIGGENSWPGWKSRFPFLFHGENPPLTSNTIPISTDLDMNVALSGAGENSRLRITLSKYALNGTWLGFEDLSTQLSLCDGTKLEMSQYLEFGTSMEKTCNLNVYSLKSAEEPIFYDPFILYSSGTQTMAYPLPIQILTGTSDSWVNPLTGPLYRRFFLYDNVLGFSAETPTELSYVRFLVSAQLRINLRGDEKIYPPVLTLRYETRDMSEVPAPSSAVTHRTTGESDEVRFPSLGLYVRYGMSMQIFNLVVLITTVLLCIVALFVAILQSIVFLRKREFAMLDMEILFKFAGDATNNVANAIFLALFVASLYLYWFFKYQNSAFVLLPSGDDLIGYYVYIALGLLLKLVDVMITLYKQTHYDIFFVDWEKPKEMIDNTKKSPSVWRTLFVAKQWNKLSSQRLINLEFTLLVVIVFLEGVGFLYISTEQPDASNFSRNFSTNSTLRFAVSSMIWVSIVISAYIFKKYIHHRFVKSPLNTFIDVCSLSNISVIALAEHNFGYYIHGASVHEHADLNMDDFDQALYREQEDAVLRRGMIPDANVQAQTFEIFVTHQFRLQFNEMLKMRIQTFRVRARMNALPSQQQQGLNMNARQTIANRMGFSGEMSAFDSPERRNQPSSEMASPNQAQNPQMSSPAPAHPQMIQSPQQQQLQTQSVQPGSPAPNQQVNVAQSGANPQAAGPENGNVTGSMIAVNNSILGANQIQAMRQMFGNRDITFQDTALYKFINPNRRVNPTPELYDAYNEMNEFLKERVNEIRSDYMKRIRSKDLFYRVGIPPQMTMIHANVMYVDSAKSFSKLFLSGIELKMMIFNIFLFSVVDLMHNAIVAMVVVYLINFLLLRLRRLWTRNMIINRTLLSEKMI